MLTRHQPPLPEFQRVSGAVRQQRDVRRILKGLWWLMRVMLAGALLGAAGWCLTRTGPAASLPLTPLSDLARLAEQRPVVRTTGEIVGDDGQPEALQRVRIDDSETTRRPAVPWKNLLRGEGLTPPEPAYDMVSPPRVHLVDGPVSVLLQTEDIDVRFWPAAVDAPLAEGQPYPALTLLPTLPDLPPRSGAVHLRLWQFPPHTRVTVVGQVVLDGETPDLQADLGQPFIISALPYEQVVALERQVSAPNRAIGGICLLGAVGIVLGLLRRR